MVASDMFPNYFSQWHSIYRYNKTLEYQRLKKMLGDFSKNHGSSGHDGIGLYSQYWGQRKKAGL